MTTLKVHQIGDVRYARNQGFHWQDDPHPTLCFRIIEVVTDIGNISDDGGKSWEEIDQTQVRIRFQDCGAGREGEEKLYTVNSEMLNTSWSIAEAKQAQRTLCEDKGYPHFAPYNGQCQCGKNIYTRHNGKGHITGCPHCGKSYCD